jgi:hypothetical protein
VADKIDIHGQVRTVKSLIKGDEASKAELNAILKTLLWTARHRDGLFALAQSAALLDEAKQRLEASKPPEPPPLPRGSFEPPRYSTSAPVNLQRPMSGRPRVEFDRQVEKLILHPAVKAVLDQFPGARITQINVLPPHAKTPTVAPSDPDLDPVPDLPLDPGRNEDRDGDDEIPGREA